MDDPYGERVLKPKIGLTNSPAVHNGLPVEALTRVYIDAVRRAGALPLLMPVLDPIDAASMVEGLDGLLLTGGGDVDPACYGAPRMADTDEVNRARDDWELALVFAAMERGIPVLGICRGSQIINVAMGGTLMQHLPLVTEQAHRERERFDEHIHDVEVLPGSVLAWATGSQRMAVNTLHHQAVAEVGRELRVTGWAPDGVIEAIESDGPHRMLGVQWHPELMSEFAGHAELFTWLVGEALRGAVRPSVLVDMTGPDTLGGDLAVA